MRLQTLALLAVTCLVMGYYFWSLFVNSRYQALCNISYWSATKEEIEGCQEMKRDFDARR